MLQLPGFYSKVLWDLDLRDWTSKSRGLPVSQRFVSVCSTWFHMDSKLRRYTRGPEDLLCTIGHSYAGPRRFGCSRAESHADDFADCKHIDCSSGTIELIGARIAPYILYYHYS